MPTKGGRRQREKRLKFQIKSAINTYQDPFPYYRKLSQLYNEFNHPRISNQGSLEQTYKLHELTIDLTFPNYKTIPKTDPRRLAYKLKNLFGTEFR